MTKRMIDADDFLKNLKEKVPYYDYFYSNEIIEVINKLATPETQTEKG